MNIRSIIVSFVMFFVTISVYALPNHPYAPWKIICLDNTNQTITYPNGTMREVLPSETWRAELQNAKGLESSSVRCWCMDSEQYSWDTECLGSGNGWWTMIKLLTSEGQSCTCPAGQAIMVEMDHNTCGGTEGASGFFQCSSTETSAGVENEASWRNTVVAVGTVCVLYLTKT